MSKPRSIATTIDDIARKTIGKDWNLYSALLNHWREIVGQEYADVTSPVKVSFPKGKAEGNKWVQGHRTDGVLHIRLPQGLTMEFTCLTEQIRQRITASFGYEAITRIVFEPYYGAPPNRPDQPATEPIRQVELPQEINDIGDPDLRAALEGLGKTICK